MLMASGAPNGSLLLGGSAGTAAVDGSTSSVGNISTATMSDEMEVSPVTILPHDVIEKLAELDLELSEGTFYF